MTVDIEIEVDTEMGTEIEMVMEIDTEIDTETETEILIYGDIAVANVATSPIRSRSAMTRWQRRSASALRWVPNCLLYTSDAADE